MIAEMTNNLKTLEQLNAEISLYEERLTLALDIGKVGVWDWNLVTNKLVWDRRMHELFGTNSLCFDGTYEAFAKLVHPEDLPSVNKAVDKTMANGDHFNYCYRLAADSHKVIIGIGRVTYNKDTGKPERMIGVCVESPRTEQRCLLDCHLAKKAHGREDPDQFKMEFEFCAS